jgi:hypothetical protein
MNVFLTARKHAGVTAAVGSGGQRGAQWRGGGGGGYWIARSGVISSEADGATTMEPLAGACP